MQRFAASVIVCSILIALCTAQQQSGTRSDDERAIRATDAVTLKAAQEKNADIAASNYTDDATWLPPNAPLVKGRDGIRAGWAQMMALPGFTIDWQITSLDVARSGDMAYTIYAYQMNFTGPTGAPVKDHGKDLVVWKKQADGKWKMQAEAFSSDLTAAKEPEQKPIVAPVANGKFGTVPNAPECFTVAVERGDPASGPSVLLAKFAPGCVAPFHWHTPSETAMLVSGALEVQMKDDPAMVAHQGDFLYLPGHHVHRATCLPPAACTLFLSSDAAFDIHWVDAAGNEIPLETALKNAKAPAK